MLKNEYGRFMQSYELLPVLGFKPGCHLPADGFAPTTINGVTFKCEPATPARKNTYGRLISSSKARIFYLCSCEKWIPAGRAGQHLKGKSHK